MADSFSQMLGWLFAVEAWLAMNGLLVACVGVAAWFAFRRRTPSQAPAPAPEVVDPTASIFHDDPESALNTAEPTRDLSPAMRRVPYRGPKA